ncbi:MAG: hypothetical protein HZB15_01965, partial [Actinobacteria bacterium]|nr:hypothetical protein [Actinomycetota bacterium]
MTDQLPRADEHPPLVGSCPFSGAASVAADFTPFEDPYLSAPYELFARARRDAPVFYSSEIDHWVVSRYDDVRTVMRDVDRFSAANVQSPVTPWPDDAVAAFEAHGFGLR